jgi:hypothetical protein
MSEQPPKGFKNGIADTINGWMNPNRLFVPAKGTFVTIDGAPVRELSSKEHTVNDSVYIWKRQLYDTATLLFKGNQFGDGILRSNDDHDQKTWGDFLRSIYTGPYRMRHDAASIVESAKKHKLDRFYKKHDHGVEITFPEKEFDGSTTLLDIFRQDLLEYSDEPGVGKITDQGHLEKIKRVDRYDALRVAVMYISNQHKNIGAIGELLSNDIIYQHISDDDQVKNPTFNMPDELFLKKWNLSDTQKEAIELLDFMMCLMGEEYHRQIREGNDPNEGIAKVREIIEESYALVYTKRTDGKNKDHKDGKEVLDLVFAMASKGLPNLIGDRDLLDTAPELPVILQQYVAIHNRVRLNLDEKAARTVREQINK